MSRFFAGLGALAYFAWGALHLLAAANAYMWASKMEAGLVQGRLQQGSFYVFFFAVVAVIVALGFTWRNKGYWAGLIAVSAADIPFVLFIVLPGHMTGIEAVLGPALWISGAALTTLARLTAPRG